MLKKACLNGFCKGWNVLQNSKRYDMIFGVSSTYSLVCTSFTGIAPVFKSHFNVGLAELYSWTDWRTPYLSGKIRIRAVGSHVHGVRAVVKSWDLDDLLNFTAKPLCSQPSQAFLGLRTRCRRWTRSLAITWFSSFLLFVLNLKFRSKNLAQYLNFSKKRCWNHQFLRRFLFNYYLELITGHIRGFVDLLPLIPV